MDALDGILEWCRSSAPGTADAVRPPAAEDVFWEAYGATGGSTWPEDLVAFYRWCDGTERTPAGYLFPRFRPLGAQEVTETWQMLMLTDFPQAARARSLSGMPRSAAFSEISAQISGEVEAAREKAGTEAGLFVPAFLPVADDQSGSYLMVDRRGGPKRGSVVVFDRDEADAAGVRWRNIATLCQNVYDAMASGKPVKGTRYRPVALGGALTWEKN